MNYFVGKHSIVRRIWGKADTILFIFAGASAEFALNKAVDWLYFTGKLPADPLGRLFSTVSYARAIIFATEDDAMRAIDQITAIHKQVETARAQKIPAWAYRDVLYMLVDYSIRSYQLLERQLSHRELNEVYNVFYRVGCRMGIPDLPVSYTEWQTVRQQHLQAHLLYGVFTQDLYRQYRKHLGTGRYLLLKMVQQALVPPIVKNMLGINGPTLLQPILWAYKIARSIKLDKLLRHAILPAAYKTQIQGMEVG